MTSALRLVHVLALALWTAQTAPTFYATRLTMADMRGQQAVLETSLGRIVIDLLPEAAPNHVGHFIEAARGGDYNGTVFHRAVKFGIVQGGDPLSKDPAKREVYGTGGLRVLKAERSSEKTTRGAVAAIVVPGDPDSAGSQFFICVTDQPGLEGQYTIFGRVVEGLEVVSAISESPIDAKGRIIDRIEIREATIRTRPPAAHSTETPTELAAYRAVLDTTAGSVTLGFMPEKAPDHVRNFLRLAEAGVFDGVAFHRVVPGFVIQTGVISTRSAPLTQAQQNLIHTLAPEFNDTPHVKGIVSMARGDDPGSATTSFFICTGTASSLDGKYTVFGRVLDGVSAIEAIERVPLNGEAPVSRVEVVRVRIEKPAQ